MTDEALNRILALFHGGNVCLVFADHRTCHISEQVYGLVKNSNYANVVIVGYSVRDRRDSTFTYEGADIRFSEEEYDSVVRSLPDLRLKNGHVSIMVFVNGSRYSRTIGSTKTSVKNNLERIDQELECGLFSMGMSRASMVLTMGILMVALVAVAVFLVYAVSTFHDTGVMFGCIAMMLMIIAGMTILIVRNARLVKSEWGYPDPDLAMVISLIPGGFGLLYLRKLRGIIYLALIVAYISAIVIAVTGLFGVEINDETLAVCVLMPIFSVIMAWGISVMETQAFCHEKYGDSWNSLMSRTMEPYEMYMCTLLYAAMIITTPIMFGFSMAAVILAVLSVLYPIREHMLRKRLLGK